MTVEKIKSYALENNIPILNSDSLAYITTYIKENNITSILEIGTAIAYSTICFANIDENITVTSIEKDEERYKIAKKNVKELGLDNRIKLIEKDALEVELNSSYDLIFIDASKTKNISFFNKFVKYLKNNGTIITDNIGFHGLVYDETLIKTKNQRNITNKIKEYIKFLDTNEKYETHYINIGDILAITKEVI